MIKPEKTPVFTVAEMYYQFFILCKSEGKDQDYVAARLKLSPSRLSKYLTIINACDSIKNFADNEKIEDIEALYLLSKIEEIQPEVVLKFIADWRGGKIKGSLRAAAKKLTSITFKKNDTKPNKKLTLTIDLTNSDSLFLHLKTGCQETTLNLDKIESKSFELHIPEVHLHLTLHANP